MKEKLLSVVKNPAVRKAFVGLLIALAAALGYGQLGCASMPPAKQAELDTFECRVAAVAPAVEPVFDAVELVRDIYAGKADLSRVLQLLETAEPEVRAVLEALSECEPAPQRPSSVEPG